MTNANTPQPKVDVDRLLSKIGDLPPTPHVAQKALKIINDPNSSMSDLARVMALDQAMAAMVLQWANSAYFGLVNPVTTIQQAVAYLGHITVQSLILTAAYASFLGKAVPGYGMEAGDLWKHSVGVAAGARLIVARFDQKLAEEAYHAGLLCDIGKLVFDVLWRKVDFRRSFPKTASFSDLENHLFGIDHASLGAEIGRRWKLPSQLVEAIEYHHKPSQAKDAIIIASAVHLADAAMMMFGIGLGRDGLQYPVDQKACVRLKWMESDFGQMIDRVIPMIQEAESFLAQPA